MYKFEIITSLWIKEENGDMKILLVYQQYFFS